MTKHKRSHDTHRYDGYVGPVTRIQEMKERSEYHKKQKQQEIEKIATHLAKTHNLSGEKLINLAAQQRKEKIKAEKKAKEDAIKATEMCIKACHEKKTTDISTKGAKPKRSSDQKQ